MPKGRWIWSVGGVHFGGEFECHGEGNRRVGSRGLWAPSADVYVCDDSIEVILEVPGVSIEALDIIYDPDTCVLSVRGYREAKTFARATSCQQLELHYGEFQRDLELPRVAVEFEHITAHYEDGFVYVTLPKRPGGAIPDTIRVESD